MEVWDIMGQQEIYDVYLDGKLVEDWNYAWNAADTPEGDGSVFLYSHDWRTGQRIPTEDGHEGIIICGKVEIRKKSQAVDAYEQFLEHGTLSQQKPEPEVQAEPEALCTIDVGHSLILEVGSGKHFLMKLDGVLCYPDCRLNSVIVWPARQELTLDVVVFEPIAPNYHQPIRIDRPHLMLTRHQSSLPLPQNTTWQITPKGDPKWFDSIVQEFGALLP